MKHLLVAPLLAAMAASSAHAVVLINFNNGASSVGNGALFSDSTGPVAPAATVLAPQTGTLSTNTFGRALIANGSSFATTLTSISTIEDNPGVGISGFSAYRVFYNSGSDAYGFLENGGRMGKTNAANDGQAFSNSSDYVLVSDSHAATVAIGNTINFSYLAGTDGVGATTALRTFLLFNGTTSVEVTSNASQTSFANSYGTVTGSYVTTAAYTSVGIYVFADG